MKSHFWLSLFFGTLLFNSFPHASCEEDEIISEEIPKVDEDIGKAAEGSRTDDEVIEREEEAIQIDGLSPSEMKQIREQSEKHVFQAEVNRMMKLIINSLYKNKEIFLREIISNASDALDKIRIMSLTDESVLSASSELTIKVKVDRENNWLHVTDTGIGMTRNDLLNNLGTIAKSGTSDFFEKMSNAASEESVSDLIGQFGVGFYSTFLVADKVVVTTKHNNDTQHIWESDSESFVVVEDPRGDTLGRGTTVSLYLKEEASDFLDHTTITNLIQKYSQFINFPIYLWSAKTIQEEVLIEEEKKVPDLEEEEVLSTDEDSLDDAEVKEEVEEVKPKTKMVSKTVWDWELMNETKPIWQRPTKEISDEEYDEFYKAISKDSSAPMARTHFAAEGEITFKSILYIPSSAPLGLMHEYGQKKAEIKKKYLFLDYVIAQPDETHAAESKKSRVRLCGLTFPESLMYVRRVFITDDFEDMMPKYLRFVRGVVDSDDLPLNVSRETLQQHKLLKVIKKKLVRKALEMIKKMDSETYLEKFWPEFGTNIKLGVIEDQSNRTRLAKLLRFYSSNHSSDVTSLQDYVKRMKENQEKIYYCAANGRVEAENSPFVERLLKKGYEVLYLTEAVDEYTIQSLPEFDAKNFQNVAKEGLGLDEGKKAKEKKEAFEKKFEPLATWLQENALKDRIEKVMISEHLSDSPCALVASQYGWSGNMERIMKAQAYKVQKDVSADESEGNDVIKNKDLTVLFQYLNFNIFAKLGDQETAKTIFLQRLERVNCFSFYTKQKKTFEINPRHPLIKSLLQKVEINEEDQVAHDIAQVMFDTAVLRSGYTIPDSVSFAKRILEMMYSNMDIDPNTPVDEEELEEDDVEEIEAEEEVEDNEKTATEQDKKEESNINLSDNEINKEFRDEL